MKVRGEKRYTLVEAVLAERTKQLVLLVLYCVEMRQKRA